MSPLDRELRKRRSQKDGGKSRCDPAVLTGMCPGFCPKRVSLLDIHTRIRDARDHPQCHGHITVSGQVITDPYRPCNKVFLTGSQISHYFMNRRNTQDSLFYCTNTYTIAFCSNYDLNVRITLPHPRAPSGQRAGASAFDLRGSSPPALPPRPPSYQHASVQPPCSLHPSPAQGGGPLHGRPSATTTGWSTTTSYFYFSLVIPHGKGCYSSCQLGSLRVPGA